MSKIDETSLWSINLNMISMIFMVQIQRSILLIPIQKMITTLRLIFICPMTTMTKNEDHYGNRDTIHFMKNLVLVGNSFALIFHEYSNREPIFLRYEGLTDANVSDYSERGIIKTLNCLSLNVNPGIKKWIERNTFHLTRIQHTPMRVLSLLHCALYSSN